MSDIFEFPSERIVYGNITNIDPAKAGGEPVFVSDILATQQEAFAAVRALAGINYAVDTFYILQGLEYDAGAGTYEDGVIYFKADTDSVGRFYFVASFSEGNAILPDAPTGENAKLYTDAVVRPTYNYYTASPATFSSGVTTPQFDGSMDEYRLANFFLKAQINAINTLLATYGNVVTRNASATAANGVVPLWDNVYSKSQVLPLVGGTMTGAIVLAADPSANLQAATKQYVDGFAKILKKGNRNIGDVPGTTTTYTITLGGDELNDNNYLAFATIKSNGSGADYVFTWNLSNYTTTSFDITIKENESGIQNISIDWFIIAS